MDDLTNSIESILVAASGHEQSHKHPRFSQFKSKTSGGTLSQEQRRHIVLQEQKKRRLDLIEAHRHKEQSVVAPASPARSQSSSKKSRRQSSSSSSSLQAISSQFVNKLMFSEWLEDRPSDLASNWVASASPVGKRCLVVAAEGNTSAYNKAGKLIAKHSSRLPGGCKETKSDATMLDCIYSDPLRTYFVLDCLEWKCHPIVDSDTEFRFYWLKCKLDECSGIDRFSSDNPYVFSNVPRLPVINDETMYTFLEKSFNFDLDGLLFYHKEAHYTGGYTPLVGWLKAYMLPEILGMRVPQWIVANMPGDYSAAVRREIVESNERIDKLKEQLKTPRTDAVAATADTDAMTVDNFLLLSSTTCTTNNKNVSPAAATCHAQTSATL